MINQAKVVSILSMKGGAGKTSITSLLARYYAEAEGKQVLVVDFDSSAGITGLLTNQIVTKDTPSVVEMLQDVMQYTDPNKTFSRALIKTKLEKSKGWIDNGGSILLIPCKPALDNLLRRTDRNLLNSALGLLQLPKNCIILIDSGPDAININMAAGSADIVFSPIRINRQAIYPLVDTLRVIIYHQLKNKKPLFGGLVINQKIQAQWEENYIESFTNLFDSLRHKIKLTCSYENLFIIMEQSRFIQRGKHMTWSIRDEIFDPIRQMALVIDQSQPTDQVEKKYGK